MREQLLAREGRSRQSTHGHPLLGARLGVIAATPDSHHWEKDLGGNGADEGALYRENGRAVLPVAAFAELALAAAKEAQPEKAWTVSGLEMHEPLVVSESAPRVQQVSLSLADGGATLRVHTRDAERGEAQGWVLHAVARMKPSHVSTGRRGRPSTKNEEGLRPDERTTRKSSTSLAATR
jgi:acyl transferase domain-containing protein